MDKWEYLKLSSWDKIKGIFLSPITKEKLDWLLEKYPKIIQRELHNINYLPTIYYDLTEVDEKQRSFIFYEVLAFLGSQGWEAYAHDDAYYFKRRL